MLKSDKLNLGRLQFLVADHSHHSLNIASAILSGFGARSLLKCATAKEARDHLCGNGIDFLLIAGEMPEESGYNLVRWLRRSGPEANRFIPVIALSGHVRRSQVLAARDSGLQAVITKPLVPQVLFERILWLAKDRRQFIECDDYCGPDRRFADLGPPDGVTGRREGDADKLDVSP